MRLLIVASNFPPVVGGIQTYAYEVARHLAPRCEDLLVVAPRSPGFREHDTHSPFTILRLPSAGDDLALSGIAPLARLLRGRRFDAAFATHWAPGFAVHTASRLAARALPVFVAAHGKELLHRPLANVALAQTVYDHIRARALRTAAGFFPVSRRTAELLRERGVTPERITVAHNGVDPTRFAPRVTRRLREQLGAEGPIVLSVARLVSRKGIDTVLRALPQVLASVPSVIYAVVGGGPDQARLQALCARLGLTNSVRFLPSVGNDLPDYYNGCDLFVLPTREEPGDIEGFGLVFLEAGACEKPVIGARAGGVVDAISDGVTGLLVPPDDPSRLAEAMLELLSNRARAEAMGHAARERVLREGTWDHTAAKIADAIEHALR